MYVHITSRGIIEDTHSVHIAPYSVNYSELQDDFKAAGLNSAVNNWTMIDDFNWLNKNEKSPNWDFAPEDQRKVFNL